MSLSDFNPISSFQEWVPFDKQEQYIQLPFSVKEGFFGGSVGTGKSDLVIRLPLIYRFHEHPQFKGIILRRTLSDLEKEIVGRCKRLYGTDGKKALGARYNESKYRFTFPSGATIYLGHCEHDDDIENYDGAEYNFICFDEIEHFNERPYLYLTITRGRSSTAELPVIIRNTGMPGGEGHAWVKKRFIDPAPDGGKLILDRKSGSKRIFIKAMPYDNPYLVKNNPNYYNELNGLPEADRRAKLGDWNAFSGQVFTEYREKPFPDEPAYACHLIQDDTTLENYWPTILVVDIGTTALTYGLFLTTTPSGQVVADEEYAVNGGYEKYPNLKQHVDIATWATDLGELARKRKIVDVVLDSTAFESRPEGVTIAELFQRHSGLTPRPADKGPNSRIQGRMLVQEFLRWKQKPDLWSKPTTPFDNEVAARLLRMEGQESYEKYCRSFDKPKEEKLPKLLIKERCKLLREVIPICVYDTSNVEDIAEFHGDDPIDTLRYGCRAIDFYLNSKVQLKQTAREEKLNQVRDAHVASMMLYKMREKEKKFGVRRFRRRI